MSTPKRRAIRQLNKDNWEDENTDPDSDLEIKQGKDEICNRKKLVAKRKSNNISQFSSSSLTSTSTNPLSCFKPKICNSLELISTSPSSTNATLTVSTENENVQNVSPDRMAKIKEYYLNYMTKLNKSFISEMVDAIIECPYIDLSNAFYKYSAYIDELKTKLDLKVEYDLECCENATYEPNNLNLSFQSNHQVLQLPQTESLTLPSISMASNNSLVAMSSIVKTSTPTAILFPIEFKCTSAPACGSFGPGYFSTVSTSTTSVSIFAPITSDKVSVPFNMTHNKPFNSQTSYSLDINPYNTTNQSTINPISFGQIFKSTTINDNSTQVADFSSKNQGDAQTIASNEHMNKDEDLKGTAEDVDQKENVDGEPEEFIIPPSRNDVPQFDEPNCVWVKRCKLFRKDSDKYVDVGVGFCYLKDMTEINKDKEKIQMLIRAANTSGTILLNTIIYKKETPVTLKDKNNVLVVVPSGPSNQATTYLIRVKLEEDAQELFRHLTAI